MRSYHRGINFAGSTTEVDRSKKQETGVAYTATPLNELLVQFSTYQSNKLRKRLLAEGLKERKCEKCGLTEWNGKTAPLELDHINGIKTDNRIENLRILCPNCHAQTEHYRGRNTRRYRGPVLE